MKECLVTDKICPISNKKCKVCVFDSCKEVLEMIDKQQKIQEEYNINKILKQLPEQCKNCSFLEIIDIRNQVVRCPYFIKDKCILDRS